ncbi:MAG: glycosyltransferase family 2 protein [bacterium]|nr:glycosyltransferase family 2 protein [bacterium]
MISVIMPLFNKAPYLHKSVLSVLNQSMPDLELLLVDNCSSDNWQEQIKDILDPRLILLTEPNRGVSNARNCGICQAKFSRICFLDADDFWEKDHLMELVKMIQLYPKAGILSNSYQISDAFNQVRSRKLLGVVTEGNYNRLVNFFKSYNEADVPVNSNSVCISKEILLEMGSFDTAIFCGEDILLWVRIFLKYPVYISNYCGSTYQLGAINRSNVPSYLLHELPVIAKLESVYADSKKAELKKDFSAFIAKHLFVSLIANIKCGNRLSAQQFFRNKKIYFYPNKIKLLVAALLCFLPTTIGNKLLHFLEQNRSIN